MGLISKLFGRSSAIETRASGADYLPSHSVFGPIGYNDSGVEINESNALISSTVWACVSIIAQTIATLPVHVVTRDDGDKQYQHPVAMLLGMSPNPYMTPAVFREALLHNALLWGAGYAAIERDELGEAVALYPLASNRTRPIRQNGEVVYETRTGGETHYLSQDQVICLLGWSNDGISPLSPIQSGKQAIGLSVAMERYAAKAFSGANVGGILRTPPMNKDAMTAFVESWRSNYSGLDSAFRVAVLPDPMSFTPTTLKPQEGQLVEARQAIVLDICRYFRVPPWMVGVLEKSSYASLEAQSLAFYQQTIQPWCIKLEQELMGKLLLEREKPTHDVKFNLDSLLRATTTERYGAYQQGRQGGWLSINDIRRKENLPPVQGGDDYLSPLNMQQVGQPPQPVAVPAALPAPKDDGKAEAVRAMLLATIKRFVVKESKAVQRAAGKRSTDELRTWAATFYDDHRKLVAETLAPVLAAAGLTLDAEQIAKRHCDDGVRLIDSAIKQTLEAAELVEDIEERSVELVDYIIKDRGADNAAA